MIGLLVMAIIAVVIITAVTTGLFGLIDTKDQDVEFVEKAIAVGFQIERNIVDRRARTLNGEYQGTRASIVISRSNENLSTGYPEVQRAVQWLNLGTNWEALKVGRALVLCEPVPECQALAAALTEAESSS